MPLGVNQLIKINVFAQQDQQRVENDYWYRILLADTLLSDVLGVFMADYDKIRALQHDTLKYYRFEAAACVGCSFVLEDPPESTVPIERVRYNFGESVEASVSFTGTITGTQTPMPTSVAISGRRKGGTMYNLGATTGVVTPNANLARFRVGGKRIGGVPETATASGEPNLLSTNFRPLMNAAMADLLELEFGNQGAITSTPPFAKMVALSERRFKAWRAVTPLPPAFADWVPAVVATDVSSFIANPYMGSQTSRKRPPAGKFQ